MSLPPPPAGSMATSSLQHQNTATEAESLLCLDLSLGGIFSAAKRKCSASFSSQKLNHQPRFRSQEKEKPLLPSRQSINKLTTQIWDVASDEAPSSSTTPQKIPHQIVDWRNSPFQSTVLDSDSTQIRGGAHQSQSDMTNFMMLEGAPAGSEYCPLDGTAAAHQVCPETPSFVSCSNSTDISCTLCATRGHEQAAPCISCPSSTLSFLPSSGMSSAFCNGSNSYRTTMLQTSTDAVEYMFPTKRKPSNGEEEGVSCMLPSKRKPDVFEKEGTNCLRPFKRKPSLGNEEGKSSHSSSSELLENGGTLEYEQSSIQNRAAEIEAPRSRCGSNSDILGFMDPLLVVPISTCSMVNTHSFAMLPVPASPFSVPIQWAFSLPYSMHHTSFPPEYTPLPWSPFVCASPSALQPGAVPHDESRLQNNQGTNSGQEKAPTCDLTLGTPLVEEAKAPPLSTIVQESKPHASMSKPVIDRSTSALRSFSSSQTAHFSSISHVEEVRPVCVSTLEPVNVVRTSATSRPLSSPLLKANFSSVVGDSELQQNDQLKASKSSVARADFLQQHSKSSCAEKTDDVGLVGSVQSQHSVSPRRKPAKTVRFAPVIDEADSVKSSSNGDGASSVFSRMCKSKTDDSFKGQSGSDERSARERDQDEGSENTGIASESSEKEVGAPFKVNGGKIEGKIGAELPWVSTTGAGPNGKTIYGVMYITKSKRACLICSCHGTHMSPSEFVQHSGSTDLSNPERSIVVGCLPFVNQVVPSGPL